MSGLTNEEMRARLKIAFDNGKMSEEQYLRNLEKFPVDEPEEPETIRCPGCNFEIVQGSTCPFCEEEETEEELEPSAEMESPNPRPVTPVPAAEPEPFEVPSEPEEKYEPEEIYEPEESVDEPLPVIAQDTDKEEKVAQYVDKLISLGIKPAAQREALIIHYLAFDESHMQKEIEFNQVHTDLMEYFVEAAEIIEEYPESPDEYNEVYYDIPESVVKATMVAQCDSCGHDSKGKKSCPRCGADQIHRITERQLIAVSLVLLLIGVAYIGVAGAYSDTPISVIGDLRETDNFRQIRVIGKVADLVDYYPEKYEDSGTIRLLLDDGTGDIWVKVVPFVAEKLLADGIIPGFGDTVDCEGSLFVGDDNYMQIKIRDTSLIRIKDREYQEITMDDLVPAVKESFEVGSMVSITGQIQGNFYIDGFARILDLASDDGKTVSVFIPDTIGQMSGELDMDDVYLSTVTVKGALEWYDSDQSWEIIPTLSSDIEVISHYEGDSYTTLTIAQLISSAEAYEGDYVEVHDATVDWVYGDGDWLFKITDSTTSETFSIIMDNSANTTAYFQVGDVVHLRGLVIPYNDSWEISVRASSSDYALVDYEYGGGA